MNSLSGVKKVLIVNIFGIGDVLFTTPIISNIKKFNPNISIGYICNNRTREVIEKNPAVDRVFVYERDEFNAAYKESIFKFLKKLKMFINEIKAQGYDVLIDLSLNSCVGLIAIVSGIKHRYGYNYKSRGLFLNHRTNLAGFEGRHVVEYYLDLLRNMGIPIKDKQLRLYSDQSDKQWADQYLKDSGLTNTKVLIGIVPGGGASWGKQSFLKRWQAEKFSKLADKLIEKYHAQIILFGGSSEVELCQEIKNSMTATPFLACGNTSLGQFSALSCKCKLLVLNDGGSLHMAVASGVKTVSIFGPVDENVYGPYPRADHLVVTKDVFCRPCYRRFRTASCNHLSCLKDINVEDVIRKVERFL